MIGMGIPAFIKLAHQELFYLIIFVIEPFEVYVTKESFVILLCEAIILLKSVVI